MTCDGADELVAERPPDLKKYGLDASEARWRFLSGEREVLNLVIGKPDLPAVIAAPQNMAIQAGFAAGDTIVAVDGKPVRSYSPAIEAIMLDAIQHKNAVVDVSGF